MSADVDRIRYPAFLSYCHRDMAFARRLHRRLEGYALPRRLVGRPGPRGPVPARLAPIFRDREELSAAGDLSAEVRAALAASGALIVVCSTGAKASPWVAREIETFRALHPDRPVLAVLAEGEPADTFPAALLAGGTEPLAADFRKGRDGAALGFLKLVSGVAGVGLDELIQRDAQRRLRAVTAVTAGAVAVMLAMGALAVFAFQARAEADRRRADAEGLVEFMLTDLRAKLKGVDRLDIMLAVNERALAHYAGEDLRRLKPDELERRARLLTARGEDDVAGGRYGEALKQFLEARRTTAALLALEPDRPSRIFNQAQSEYWVALVDWRTGRLLPAERGFRRYRELADRLLRIDSKNPDWLMEASYADTNLGVLLLRDRDTPTVAWPLFQRAFERNLAATRLRPGDPDLLYDLADAHAWLADCERALARYAAARADRVAQLDVLNGLLSQDPRNGQYRRALLGAQLGLAQIDIETGDPGAARVRLQSAFTGAGEAVRDDADNDDAAQLRIVIGLTLLGALAESPRVGVSPSIVSDLLEVCDAKVASSEQELRDYCALRVARWARVGPRRDAAFTYLAKETPRLSRVRRSPRWSVDFSQELSRIPLKH